MLSHKIKKEVNFKNITNNEPLNVLTTYNMHIMWVTVKCVSVCVKGCVDCRIYNIYFILNRYNILEKNQI